MYEPKTKPYAHQTDAWTASWDKRYWALFCEMGTGKTKITIDTMGALYEAGRIDAALILAPKGVFDNWVTTEIPVHLPDRIPHQIMRFVRRCHIAAADYACGDCVVSESFHSSQIETVS